MTAAATRAKIQAADRKFYAKPVPKPRSSHADLLRRVEASRREEAS